MEHKHPPESGKGNSHFKNNEYLWEEFQKVATKEEYREKYLSWDYYEKYDHELNPYRKVSVENE